MKIKVKLSMNYLGIDIGGSWIKGAVMEDNSFDEFKKSHLENLKFQKVKSPLCNSVQLSNLFDAFEALISLLEININNIAGIGISTAGIVDYSGKKMVKVSKHLSILKDSDWILLLSQKFNCPISLINDADAAAIGIAELGGFQECKSRSVGIMTIGTGLGFSVWRNGRRWRPGKVLNLLGSIRTPSGTFNEIVSVPRLASKHPENDVTQILSDPIYGQIVLNYFTDLSQVINTAAILYNLDEIRICGGLANAVVACNFNLEHRLISIMSEIPNELDRRVKVVVIKEGNLLQLIGSLSLAQGEAVAQQGRVFKTYDELTSERPFKPDIKLQNLSSIEIIETLWQAEQDSSQKLRESLQIVRGALETILIKLKMGGRIIYVGAGASGRIAAMDAIEIPCTYGFPKDRIITLIAGGVADASIEIESNFEEDASAVPEMLLLNITSKDIVIGISVSGSAYFVQSALSLAKYRGAFSVIIQNELPNQSPPFCNVVIPLFSGSEVIAGSTRMKAGTSTKKILNFISTIAMIKMGKVSGAYMIDVACINNKLVERAQHILKVLYNMDQEESLKLLKEANMELSQVIYNIKEAPQTF